MRVLRRHGRPAEPRPHPAAGSGGSDRASNRCLACVSCNQGKADLPIQEFLAGDAARLARILKHAKTPLGDAAAVNATRWAIWRALVATGIPVQAASGGRTKWNRTRCGLPKSHTLDALCVGRLDAIVRAPTMVLAVTATGRGSYQRTRTDTLQVAPGARRGARFSPGLKAGEITHKH